MSTRLTGPRAAFALALTFAAASASAERPRGYLVDFSASWCGPCQQMAPIMARMERAGFPVRTVDIDTPEGGRLKAKYGITSLPTFVLFIDGQEVARRVGAMSERDLRTMAARIPAERPVQIAKTERSRGLLGLFPGRKKTPVAETAAVVRGNNESAGRRPPAVSGPMGASVRVRVALDDRNNFGSGTVIDSRPGRATVLSCAHVVRGVTPDSTIEVDTFFEGRPRTFVGRLIASDAEADVSLIEVSADGAWPAVKVAPTGRTPRAGEPVVSIGCGNGDDPTRQSLKVTEIDRYDGPSNIECTGLPVVGRSGGGLFNGRGELVGVCINADDRPGEADDRGIYAGLACVHDLLDKADRAGLYRESSSLAAAQPAGGFGGGAASGLETAMAEPPPAVSSAPRRPAAGVDTDLEFVVIVRSKSRPDLPSKVVIADDADPELLRLLREHMRAE